LLFAVAAGAVFAVLSIQGGVRAGEVRLSCRYEETFTVDRSGPCALYLSRQPVVRASETVEVDTVRLERDVDYFIDYSQGIVYLAGGEGRVAGARVGYSVLPFDMKPAYRLREVGETRWEVSGTRAASAPVRKRESVSDLRASGSKTVSIETGSLTDFRVSQALNLTIAGKVGDGVEVKGVLSDKDMSLGERSATARLQDLDRVFMEVRSSRALARVGDLEINESPGELLSFRRNLTGFLGDASLGRKRVVVSGAQSRTRNETALISAREGISGPYTIAGAAGELPDIVTNSEKVWLDGEPMKRGRSADYTIDYERGEIYFNPARMMRDGARIVVDYESENQEAQQQFYYARSSVGLGNAATVAVSFLNESASLAADAGTPLSAGGDPGTSTDKWVEGAKFVGLGGDYAQVRMDSVVYYEYAGEGAGEYDVAFTWVGEGKGTYSYVFSDRWDREVHVYTGSGQYVDKIQVLPERTSQVVHLAASVTPAGWLAVTSEVAQSRGHKQNEEGLWELKQDQAYTVGVRSDLVMPVVAGRSTGAVEVAASRKWIGAGYLAVARLRSPGTLERWAQDPGQGSEATDEINLTYRLGKSLTTSMELGSMGTESGDSRRRRLAVDMGSERLGFAATSEVAGFDASSGARQLQRSVVGVRVPVKWVGMELGRRYSLEDQLVEGRAEMLVEYYSMARLSGPGGSLALSVTQATEQRGAAGDSLGAYSSSLEGKAEFAADRAGRLALRGQVAHRRADYAPSTGLSDRTMTGADFGISLRDLSFITSLALDYGLANTLTSTYSTKLVRVGSGGDYDSAGNYVPGAGSYEITRYETGKQPVSRMKAALSVDTGLKGKILVDRGISSRTKMEIEGETVGGSTARLALPDPAYVLNADEVVYGKVDLSEEVVVGRVRGLAFSLTTRATQSLDTRCAGRSENQTTTQTVGRIARAGLGRTSASIEGRLGTQRKMVETSSGSMEPSARTLGLTTGLERMLAGSFRGRMAVGLSNERRTEPASAFTEMNFSPGFTVFAGALRCDGGLVLRRLVSDENASAYEINMRNSLDWNSKLNLRHGRYTSLALEYLGRKTRGARAVHNLKASLSASF
jgi:hypothetical protein